MHLNFKKGDDKMNLNEANFTECYSSKVQGSLPSGFQGHIEYVLLLPKDVDKLHVIFTFEKREAMQNIEELHSDCLKVLKPLFNGKELNEKEKNFFYSLPKSEINMSIFINSINIGSAHRDQLCKDVWISEQGSSLGFLPCNPNGGNLRIILHVLNVLNDDTPYTLAVKGVKNYVQTN